MAAQVLASPILFEKYLLGVLQLINKRGGGSFSAKDEEAAEELSKILGIAFYNQHRAARSNKPSKYGHLVDKGLVSEKDVEKPVGQVSRPPGHQQAHVRHGDQRDRGHRASAMLDQRQRQHATEDAEHRHDLGRGERTE